MYKRKNELYVLLFYSSVARGGPGVLPSLRPILEENFADAVTVDYGVYSRSGCIYILYTIMCAHVVEKEYKKKKK